MQDMLDFDMIDPDRSYALTYDNLLKMLAIQMRFRYQIFCSSGIAQLDFSCVFSDVTYQLSLLVKLVVARQGLFATCVNYKQD